MFSSDERKSKQHEDKSRVSEKHHYMVVAIVHLNLEGCGQVPCQYHDVLSENNKI